MNAANARYADPLGVEAATQAIQGRGHSRELQASRGIAALIVLLHHCSFYYTYDQTLRFYASVALNAHAAVVFFFVLSGYVLTDSVLRQWPLTTREALSFYVRRAFRIYPALWFTFIIGLLYVLLTQHAQLPTDVSFWWKPTQRQMPTLSNMALTVMGIKTTLPIPIWTLCIELIGSIFIPIVAGLLWRGTAALWIGIVILSGVSLLAQSRALHVPQHIVDFFIGGAVIPMVRALNAWRTPKGMLWLLAGAAFLITYFGRYVVGADFFTAYFSPQASMIEALGSMMLIAAISAGRVYFPALRRPILVLLGDVSYSLYLIHLIVMASAAYALHELVGIYPFGSNPYLATPLLMLITLVTSFMVSMATYRFIEKLGIEAGRTAATRLGLVSRTRDGVFPRGAVADQHTRITS